jgi:outer membrane murein-binding lipoprotein Lpp
MTGSFNIRACTTFKSLTSALSFFFYRMSYPFFTSIGISFYRFLINIYMSIVETERLSKIEGRVEELSKRVDDLKSDISSLRNEVIATRNEMNHRIDSLRSEIMSEISNL